MQAPATAQRQQQSARGFRSKRSRPRALLGAVRQARIERLETPWFQAHSRMSSNSCGRSDGYRHQSPHAGTAPSSARARVPKRVPETTLSATERVALEASAWRTVRPPGRGRRRPGEPPSLWPCARDDHVHPNTSTVQRHVPRRAALAPTLGSARYCPGDATERRGHPPRRPWVRVG
jgi:hypothetical protein